MLKNVSGFASMAVFKAMFGIPSSSGHLWFLWRMLFSIFYRDRRNHVVIRLLQLDFAAGLLRKELFDYPLQKHLAGW